MAVLGKSPRPVVCINHLLVRQGRTDVKSFPVYGYLKTWHAKCFLQSRRKVIEQGAVVSDAAPILVITPSEVVKRPCSRLSPDTGSP